MPNLDDTNDITDGSIDDDDPPWMADAACFDIGTKPFFPTRGGSVQMREDACHGVLRDPEGNETGRTNPCPVKAECLEYALVNKIRFGVWGGTTGQERTLMLRRPKNRA